MASARALRAGKAVIELSLLTGDVEKQLKKLQAKMRDFGTKLKSYGSMGLMVSGAISAPLLASIKLAGDAQESLSRFQAVFGDQTEAANKFAEATAKAVGRSSIDIKDGLSSFQAFFVGLGFGGKESRKFSEQLATLAIDFASFNNMADAEAQQRFISALSGSSEVLDMYGINIKQSALEQQLLAQGVKKAWTEVTEQEKAIARLNIIMKSMGDQGAVGDAVRTGGSLANQLKRLQGTLKDSAIAIGNVLVPAAASFVAKINSVVQSVGWWISSSPKLIQTLGGVALAIAAASVAAVAFGAVLVAITAHPIIAGITAVTAVTLTLAAAFTDVEKAAKGAFNWMLRISGMSPEGIEAIEKLKAHTKRWRFPDTPQNPAGQNPFTLPGSGVNGVDTMIGGMLSDWSRRAQNAATGPMAEARLRFGQVQGGLEFGKEFGEARQSVDDEIARERIMQMKDEVAQRKAIIKLETQIRMRELQAQGFLNEEMKSKLMELEGIQIGAVGDTAADAMQRSESFFDTRNIVQALGGRRDEQLQQLRLIARNTKPNANQQGLPVV